MMEAPINPGALWGWPAISGHHRGCHPGHPLPAQHRHRHRHRYPLPTRVSKGLPVPTPHDASCGSEGPGGAGAHSTTDSDGDDPAAAASHCPSPPQLPTPTPPTASSDGEDAAAPSSCDAPSASALNGLAVSASLETVAVSWDDVTRHYSAGRNPAPSSSWAAYIRAGINIESISSDPYGNLNAPLLEPWVYVQTNPQPMSGIPISEWGPSGSSLGAAAKARLGAQRTADADTSRRHQRLGSKRNAHPAGKKSRKGDVRLGTPSPGNVRCYPRRRKVFACAARRGQRGAQLKRTPLATLR